MNNITNKIHLTENEKMKIQYMWTIYSGIVKTYNFIEKINTFFENQKNKEINNE